MTRLTANKQGVQHDAHAPDIDRFRSIARISRRAELSSATIVRCCKRLTSGATYGKLPHRPLNSLVLPLCRKTAHSPKSDIFRFPFAAKSRFSGLRSR
jgi:hypothetical protein